MSNKIELSDELQGFHPGNEGSAAFLFFDEQNQTIRVATKYAVAPEDSVCGDGWDWGLGGTNLNLWQARRLQHWLGERLQEAGAL